MFFAQVLTLPLEKMFKSEIFEEKQSHRFFLGDLNNAYPDDEPGGYNPTDGFKAAYRPPQTYDLMMVRVITF